MLDSTSENTTVEASETRTAQTYTKAMPFEPATAVPYRTVLAKFPQWSANPPGGFPECLTDRDILEIGEEGHGGKVYKNKQTNEP
jgi:hypothetical protein